MRIRRYTSKPLDLIKGRWPDSEKVDRELENYVKDIIQNVARNGNAAVLEYTKKFDGIAIDPEELLVKKIEVEKAYDSVDKNQIKALKIAKERLEFVESQRLERLTFESRLDNVLIRHVIHPLDRIGCYAPGGITAYPSSVIMNLTPAIVAGVPEIAICTPPLKNGNIPPLTLIAGDICGVNEIYRVGGAQAIAALAYGTETIPKVMKITGPGNKYVTTAKKLVSNRISIDFPAGPSEILILADQSADPNLIALDMISQAEHGPGGISGLVTTSQCLADLVAKKLEKNLRSIPNSARVGEILNNGGFIYSCNGLEEAVSFINAFSPEHLEILIEEPKAITEQITSSALILLGPFTPVSSTDYCMGVNHVLPTGGYGKVYSGLSVFDFLKNTSIIESSKKGLESIRSEITALSEAEGLINHRLAIEGRFKE
jgi:histidinol dehydrogenase